MTTRKSATNNGFIIFKDQLSILKAIPNEQLGQAIKLLLENFDDLPTLENIAYEIIATNIRRYRKQSAISKEFGLKGGNPTLNPTLKGGDNPTLNPTLKLQEKKRKEKNINTLISLSETTNNTSSKKKRVVPDDWYPKENTILSLQRKWKDLDTNKIVEYFKNNCIAKGISYCDFDRAILNWDYSKEQSLKRERMFNGRN